MPDNTQALSDQKRKFKSDWHWSYEISTISEGKSAIESNSLIPSTFIDEMNVMNGGI